LLSNFTNNKISEKLLNDFAVVAIEMMKGGREGAGSSNELDAAIPQVTVFLYFGYFGRLLVEGIAFRIQFSFI
jgi:hypothetical protein